MSKLTLKHSNYPLSCAALPKMFSAHRNKDPATLCQPHSQFTINNEWDWYVRMRVSCFRSIMQTFPLGAEFHDMFIWLLIKAKADFIFVCESPTHSTPLSPFFPPIHTFLLFLPSDRPTLHRPKLHPVSDSVSFTSLKHSWILSHHIPFAVRSPPYFASSLLSILITALTPLR